VAGYDGVMVSLISEVAQTYLLIRTTQRRLAVAKANLGYQDESVRITTAKFEGGEVSALDVEQAQTLFYTTQASVPGFEQSLQQFKNALAILLGQPPYDLNDVLLKPRPIPTVDPEVAIGMPQDLIRRRPDIRQAERQLASQSAQIGFAITDLYPRFGISGSVGTSVSTATGLHFSDLFNSDTSGYDLFGVFQWNIFNYGRLKNNVRLQDAVFQQLLEDYRQTVLQAQGEVENAIVAFLKSQQQLDAFQSAADAAQRAVDVSTVQYQEGLVNFNTVINTLRSLAAQQDQLAAAKGNVAANLIEVYRSLGGGWEMREGQAPLDLIPEDTREEMLERGDYWETTFNDE
jgi:NodT family efflux transporter outer membrane factor (OMF) lipoprotein